MTGMIQLRAYLNLNTFEILEWLKAKAKAAELAKKRAKKEKKAKAKLLKAYQTRGARGGRR